jgi:hypothetical protein
MNKQCHDSSFILLRPATYTWSDATMKRRLTVFSTVVSLLLTAAPVRAGTRLNDELYWVPRLEDALVHAKETGRPIFMIGYTCIGGEAESCW